MCGVGTRQNVYNPRSFLQRVTDFYLDYRYFDENAAQTARKNGTPVWYLLAKDEGHGFAKKQNRDFQLYATVLFMKEYLLK